MASMLSEARLFNQDISSWDVRKVVSMKHMFYNASLFNQQLCWRGLLHRNVTSDYYSHFHDDGHESNKRDNQDTQEEIDYFDYMFRNSRGSFWGPRPALDDITATFFDGECLLAVQPWTTGGCSGGSAGQTEVSEFMDFFLRQLRIEAVAATTVL